MDWFLLLTPLAILAVVLLLGFAGCDLVFVVEPAPIDTLTLSVRVPLALTVIASQFRWILPNSTTLESSTELVRTEEADTALLTTVADNAVVGTWMVECRMQVAEGADQAADEIQVSFVLDSETIGGTARFQTTGRPANNNFEILFDSVAGPD